MQFHLLIHYSFRNKEDVKDSEILSEFPVVTIQLPIFNEKYVVNRLIDNICQLNYPKEKLHIQVLDDSTDDTLEISKSKCDEYRKKRV